ncbi:conserved hypothetical protein [Xenorhabdus bovienii str. kraussei Becker Underwood]|uniref:Uncharacterized protein n=1 Tax=Xenorhabdus bovienii str. kraussei Becker Underwood TaxID=1398204 RepID=A0A077PUW9_XENBV|nr:conserved hypothetical protein [Xenorhabdus bovienii str. kraussei Becker Underwood]
MIKSVYNQSVINPSIGYLIKSLINNKKIRQQKLPYFLAETYSIKLVMYIANLNNVSFQTGTLS